MADYTDHAKVLTMVAAAQDAESDIRERSRECDRFIDLPDGQWAPDIQKQMKDRVMMTFDETSGIVDDIAGDLEETDFAIKISPNSGEASEETADILSGLIRNVESMSDAKNVYSSAGRGIVTRGIDGWRIVTKYGQSDSFDQDFFIVPISNFIDRVWFDPSSEMRDRSDARWCVVLQSLPIDSYDEKYPKGSRSSVSDGKDTVVYNDQPESIIVGELLYKKPKNTVLIKMSNGAVYTEDNVKPVLDELKAAGVTEVDRRTAKVDVVYQHFFDGGGWLGEEKDTVFEWLPIIPVYSLFKISDNKVLWRGEVEKKMDAQRSVNYGESRKLEEGALSPRAKYWMSEEQALDHEGELETMNTNADSVQFYNPVADHPPPFMQGGAIINQGLIETTATARAFLRSGSGQVEQAQGGLFQSGEAQRLMQNKAQAGLVKYSKGVEIGICLTGKILTNAFPKLIGAKRQLRILGEDRKTAKMVTLNEQVYDQQTKKMITLNDLTQGLYDTTVSVGPAFKNRQEESNAALLSLIGVVPQIGEISADIIAANLDAPGTDAMHGRLRQMAIAKGYVPEDELTEDEVEELKAAQQAAAQQPPEPSPEEKAAESLLQDAETNRANITSQIEDRTISRDIEIEKLKADMEDKDEQLQLNKLKLEQAEDVNLMKLQQQRFAQKMTELTAMVSALAALNDDASNAAAEQEKLVADAQAAVVSLPDNQTL